MAAGGVQGSTGLYVNAYQNLIERQATGGHQPGYVNFQSISDTVEISWTARDAATKTYANFSEADRAAAERLTDYDTRVAEGKKYDDILADLRSEYSEAEAMKRFDEIMRADGWVLRDEATDDPTKPSAIQSDNRGVLGIFTNIISLGRVIDTPEGTKIVGRPENPTLSPILVPPKGETLSAFDSHYQVSSTVKETVMLDGTRELVSGTWENYNAFHHEDYDDLIDQWKSMNADRLAEESGFDAESYGFMVGGSIHGAKGHFSAVAVDADLGAVAANWLSQAGVALGENRSFRLSLVEDGKGGYSGLTFDSFLDTEGDEKRLQNVINNALKNDPNILSAFVSHHQANEAVDASSLADTFAGGSQSLTISQERRFVLSGQDPSALVMGDTMKIAAANYQYVRKVSDTFVTGVDAHSVNVSGSTAWGAVVRGAVNNGESVGSSISVSEYLRDRGY